jgi:hypothetical protein
MEDERLARQPTLVATLKEGDTVVGNILVNPKAFSTGSVGAWGNGRLEIRGRRYMVTVQLVEIGSKTPQA